MRIVLIACLVMGTACGGRGNAAEQAAPPAAAEAEQSPAPAETASEETGMLELEGTLAPTVEAGGWVLNTETGAYLLLGIAEHREEPWFKEGARVKVTGKESPDTITIFMQGTPFQVESMEPLQD